MHTLQVKSPLYIAHWATQHPVGEEDSSTAPTPQIWYNIILILIYYKDNYDGKKWNYMYFAWKRAVGLFITFRKKVVFFKTKTSSHLLFQRRQYKFTLIIHISKITHVNKQEEVKSPGPVSNKKWIWIYLVSIFFYETKLGEKPQFSSLNLT